MKGDALRVLGIDPGVARMGYAVIERSGSKLAPITFGVVRTPAGEAQARRLMMLRETLVTIISDHRPDVAAVERLFFTTNAKTAMAVGQASGVALATAAEAGLDVTDYTPNEVKQSVCGYGAAAKAQVQAMVAALLGLAEPPRPPDAADACALAICHLNRAGLASAIKRKLA
jgi:crossover junction endodeoxyribonuclease RuvC